MKSQDKNQKIIIKYKQYLKLEKALSDNTVEAYLTDLDKLFAFLTLEGIDFAEVTTDNLETFRRACMTSAFIRVPKPASFRAYARFTGSWCWKITSGKTPPNCWILRR